MNYCCELKKWNEDHSYQKDIKALRQLTNICKILQRHFKMFYRRQSLRPLAPGSPQVGEHQVQAKDQENLRCWRGMWRG